MDPNPDSAKYLVKGHITMGVISQIAGALA
jgi:hypothetical protein